MKKDDSGFVPFFMKRMTGLLLIGGILSKESTEGFGSDFSLPAYFAITNFRTWMEINLIMPLMRLSRILMEGRAFKLLALFLRMRVRCPISRSI